MGKLETILQHNQGINPPDFDYEFNLQYGQEHTRTNPLFTTIRRIVDKDTQQKINEQITKKAVKSE